MPWVQSVRGARDRIGPHRQALLSSKAEAEAIADVLGQLRPRGTCDLQILAPYNRQVRVIRTALVRAQASGKLERLNNFEKPKGKDEFGATIDGFQGEEADIVVVSLVRNNHMPLSGGVGFLSERPRLNVMLSRARRKLILVGSWEFFAKRANDDAWKDPPTRSTTSPRFSTNWARPSGTERRAGAFPGDGRAMNTRVLVPLFRLDVDYLVRHGRRWSALEHLVLWACREPMSAQELSSRAGVSIRLVSECLVNLLRAGGSISRLGGWKRLRGHDGRDGRGGQAAS